jgi:hypothetical protein
MAGLVFTAASTWFMLDDLGKAGSFYNAAKGTYEARGLTIISETNASQVGANLRYINELGPLTSKDAALQHLKYLARWERISAGDKFKIQKRLASKMMDLIDQGALPGRPAMPRIFSHEVRKVLQEFLDGKVELFLIDEQANYGSILAQLFPSAEGTAGPVSSVALARHTSNFCMSNLGSKQIMLNPAMLARAGELPENFMIQNLAEDLVRVSIAKLKLNNSAYVGKLIARTGTVNLPIRNEVLARQWAARFVKSVGKDPNPVGYWEIPEGLEAGVNALKNQGYIGPSFPQAQQMGQLARETQAAKAKQILRYKDF